MSRSFRPTYNNDLPPLPDTCLLTPFELPTVSKEFSNESVISRSPHQFITNPLLDVRVELADLSKYSQTVEDIEKSIMAEDFQYISGLNIQEQSTISLNKTLPEVPLTAPAPAERPQPIYSKYRPSPPIESLEDPNIQEELKSAFNGNVPEGEVLLLKEGDPLISLLVMSAESIDPDNYLFMPKNQAFIKAVGHDGGDTIRGYKCQQRPTHMMYMRQTGPNEMEIGPVNVRYSLQPLPPKDKKIEKFTGTPINFH